MHATRLSRHVPHIAMAPAAAARAAGCVQVSEATKKLLDTPLEGFREYVWQATCGVQVKGKGIMQTHLWQPPAADFPTEHAPTAADFPMARAPPAVLAAAPPPRCERVPHAPAYVEVQVQASTDARRTLPRTLSFLYCTEPDFGAAAAASAGCKHAASPTVRAATSQLSHFRRHASGLETSEPGGSGTWPRLQQQASDPSRASSGSAGLLLGPLSPWRLAELGILPPSRSHA
eukprot:365467-Chlamydomonas_euryale.AAC.26